MPRLHVSGFVAFSTVHTYLRKRYESDSNSLELLREHALSEITSPRCRLLLAILTRVSKFCLCLKVNMSNSTEKSNKSKSTNKKSQAEPFVWTDDEVDLLLSVVLEYKVSRTSENVDWETCQSKYSEILELFHRASILDNYEWILQFSMRRYRISSIYVIVFKSLRLQCVHTYPDSLRFQKFPLWRAFSNVCGYGVRFRRIRVDDKRNRNKMFADSNESGYVWTGP